MIHSSFKIFAVSVAYWSVATVWSQESDVKFDSLAKVRTALASAEVKMRLAAVEELSRDSFEVKQRLPLLTNALDDKSP